MLLRVPIADGMCNLLPVCDDLGAGRDGGRLLTRAEVSTVDVAGETCVGGIGNRVVCVPFTLDAALADGSVVWHKAGVWRVSTSSQ